MAAKLLGREPQSFVAESPDASLLPAKNGTSEDNRVGSVHSITTVCTVPYTAVQVTRLSRFIVSSIETSPSRSHSFFGNA